MQTYRYLASSTLGRGALALQTSGGPAPNPRFFTGFLTTPQAAAVGLLAVAEVARTRYHRPVSPASLDPVVTGSRDRLRFESFSGCCGVYARLDALPAGLDGDVVEHGTTNVDVNTPLREALTPTQLHRILRRPSDPLQPLTLGHRHLPDKHLRPPTHQPSPPTTSAERQPARSILRTDALHDQPSKTRH